jgi:NAD dependent epimerase/dehydratase family enzyme
MDDPTLSGPINITSPNPVSNAELMEQIGLQMRRKSRISVPSGILRWRFGEGADPLLTGQRVLPKVMQQAGYQWKYPDIASALTQAMSKSAS